MSRNTELDLVEIFERNAARGRDFEAAYEAYEAYEDEEDEPFEPEGEINALLAEGHEEAEREREMQARRRRPRAAPGADR